MCGPLTVIDGTLNGEEYLKLIKEVVEPELNASLRQLILMQDNAPAHKAKIVMDYLREKGIEVVDWPPQSPDLNHIELIWAYIEEKLCHEKSFPTSKAELIQRVFKIWKEIPRDMFRNLCDHVIYRLIAVADAKGDWTR